MDQKYIKTLIFVRLHRKKNITITNFIVIFTILRLIMKSLAQLNDRER